MPNAAYGAATKQQLGIALAELMEHKPLEKIAIRELTEKAGVNRQTFYYHFEDIFDLVKWVLQEAAVKLLAAHEGALFWQEGLLQLLQLIDEHRQFCVGILNSLGRSHLQRFLFADLSALIHTVIESFSNKDYAKAEYVDFLTHFFTVSLGAIVESWLRGEMDMTAEELVAYVDETIAHFKRGIDTACAPEQP